MNSIDLAFTPALDQAQLIRSKQISPLELIELYLNRIECLNPTLGSYYRIMAESAIADAKVKTEQLMGDASALPPFFGVPISIKDLNPVAGEPCSYGVKAAQKRIAEEDDGIVTKIKQAGFIILGKTATSQMGSFPYTEPPGFPPTRNPWNLDYTPGGSSGGAASALAAGLCPVAQGSDGGGSIRGPAFCCGLVGIKPARGRVSHAPAGARLGGMATNGPLGRTVADAAALLDVMAGYISGDPYWLPDPDPSFLDSIHQPLSQLKIAFATKLSPLGEATPLCKQAVIDTVTLLAEMNHAVDEVVFPNLEELIEPFTILWQCALTEANLPGFVLEKVNRWLLGRARRVDNGAYQRAVGQTQLIARKLVAFCEPYDVLVLPTYMHSSIRVGEWAKLRPAKTLEKIIHWIAPCPPFNASGQPAISIPTGFDPNGVPIGVQLVGRPASETLLIALAARIEEARPWRQKRPEIATTPSLTN